MKTNKVKTTVFVVLPWLLICGYITFTLIRFFEESSFGPMDVVRRLTSPDGKKTALLVRSYGFIDLNFVLFVTDESMANFRNITEDASFYTDKELKLNRGPIWMRRALWISHDFEPTTMRNWGEDIIWSMDSDALVVTIEGMYIFAYDFRNSKGYEDSQDIEDLFVTHK